MNRFVERISFAAPAKRIRVRTNSKHQFSNIVILAIQKRNKLYKKVKSSSSMTYKVSRTVTVGVEKENRRKMMYQKKAYYFQEQLAKNKKTQSKIQFDNLNSFGFTLNKAYQSTFFYIKQNSSDRSFRKSKQLQLFSKLARNLPVNLSQSPNKVTSKTTKKYYIRAKYIRAKHFMLLQLVWSLFEYKVFQVFRENVIRQHILLKKDCDYCNS